MAEPNIEELASRCLQRMQDEGQQVLEEICAQHPSQAHEIRGMVEQLQKLGLMDAPPGDDLVQLGDYRILKRLGGGGMGVVYLALQESLGRRVALKVMRPGFGLTEKSRARFRREIEAISTIDHQGVCTVYEANVDCHGKSLPYLAMRYIEGESLGQILLRRKSEKREGRPTTSTGQRELAKYLGYAEQIALALHCAHEAGLVHRDVKPANIMIDASGRPVILDFGLVQDADSHELTASGDLLGTPPYMSPEQVEGKPVDRRCDIYALAVTLYECLTLQTPFEDQGRQAVYSKILADPPPDPRKQNRCIGRDLWIVLSKALEKSPSDRFSTALEFAQELRRILNHETIHSVRPSLMVRTQRWMQRNQAATAVLLTLALALFTSLWFLRQSFLAEALYLASQQRYEALVCLGDAKNIEQLDPELAFKLAREALNQESLLPDERIWSRIQEILFRLHPNKLLYRGTTAFNRIRYSSRGSFLLATGMFQRAFLCTGDGEPIPLELPEAYTQDLPAAFSPDERELAIADNKGWIHRYDLSVSPPKKIWTSSIKVYPKIGSVEYHSFDDGPRLLVCSTGAEQPYRRTEKGRIIVDNRATVWRLSGGEPVDLHAPGLAQSPHGGWLPDGRIVAGGSLWNADGSKILDLEGQEGRVGSASTTQFIRRIAVGRKYFLTITIEGLLCVYTHDGQLWWKDRLRVPMIAGNVSVARFDSTGELILVACLGGRVLLLDLRTRSARPVDLEVHPNRTIMTAVFSRDGKRIAIGYWDGRVRVYGLDGTLEVEIQAHVNAITSVALSLDGRFLVTGSWGGVLRRWDLKGFDKVAIHRGFSRPDIAVAPDGKTVAIVDAAGRIVLCDEEGFVTYREDRDPNEGRPGVCIVLFSPDGSHLLRNGVGKPMEIRALEGNNLLRIRPAAVTRVLRVTRFLDDATILFRMANSQNLWKWNYKTGAAELLEPDNQKGGYVERVPVCSSVSKDKSEILVGYWDGRVRVLSLTGVEQWKSPQRVGMIRSVRFSKDARYVLAAAEDDHCYLWDRQSDRIEKFGPHFSGLLMAIFSPDERQIVTASRSGWIRVWDRKTGARVLEFAGHKGSVQTILFTHSGRLVSAGHDGTVRWWWTDLEQLKRALEWIPVPPLSEKDRRLLQLGPK